MAKFVGKRDKSNIVYAMVEPDTRKAIDELCARFQVKVGKLLDLAFQHNVKLIAQALIEHGVPELRRKQLAEAKVAHYKRVGGRSKSARRGAAERGKEKS